MRIFGVVVLYNSPVSCLANIETYISQLNELVVVDNSDCVNETLVEQIKQMSQTHFISNSGNKGLAKALNQAAEYALANGGDYLLTMDDDSSVPTTLVADMKRFISEQSAPLGIVSAAHSPATLHTNKPNFVLYTMTCGNLLSLKAYQTAGNFREDFFVDHIDHEYCLRLNSHGYKVVELPIRINHVVGFPRKWCGVSFVSRQPIRQYYMVRNGLLVAREYFKRYPIFTYKIVKLLIKELLKIVLAQDNRWQRMLFFLKGIRDGLAKIKAD